MSARPAEWREPLRQAADLLDRCAELQPEAARRCFHEAFTSVIRVRNSFVRAAGSGDGALAAAPEGAPPLQQLNALLSLMASFDFPLAGFHPERLDGARQEIHALLGGAAT